MENAIQEIQRLDFLDKLKKYISKMSEGKSIYSSVIDRLNYLQKDPEVEIVYQSSQDFVDKIPYIPVEWLIAKAKELQVDPVGCKELQFSISHILHEYVFAVHLHCVQRRSFIHLGCPDEERKRLLDQMATRIQNSLPYVEEIQTLKLYRNPRYMLDPLNKETNHA